MRASVRLENPRRSGRRRYTGHGLTTVKKKALDPAARAEKDAAPARPEAATAPPSVPSESTDLAPVVGTNLRRLRTRRGLSLERLAQISGVSRAMLGQIDR